MYKTLKDILEDGKVSDDEIDVYRKSEDESKRLSQHNRYLHLVDLKTRKYNRTRKTYKQSKITKFKL